MTAAAALHVIGMDRPPVDRRDGIVELGALVQAIGVQRDADVVRVGEAQRVVDQLRVGAVVLVDLEAAGAGREQPFERALVLVPGARLPSWSRAASDILSIAQGGSSKPAVMSVVTPPDNAAGRSSGEIRWTWLSTAPGVAMRP